MNRRTLPASWRAAILVAIVFAATLSIVNPARPAASLHPGTARAHWTSLQLPTL